tara:strand:- start:2233 stop:2427 length:195 start_codon:yes stop_codon:yes gene_type:complete
MPLLIYAADPAGHEAEESQINSSRVLEILEEGLSKIDIDQVEGKPLVVFLGRTQVGKSTTINAL